MFNFSFKAPFAEHPYIIKCSEARIHVSNQPYMLWFIAHSINNNICHMQLGPGNLIITVFVKNFIYSGDIDPRATIGENHTYAVIHSRRH